jgi:hypothetical protein
LSGRRPSFDRLLIDRADEFIQDLVASFSATRPTMALRLAVAGLYLLAAVHLVWAVMLPFFRGAVAGLIGSGASALRPTQLAAFATGVIIGGISYHLLLALAYVLLSFVVRSTRRWPRVAATIVLLLNAAVSFNGLRSPTVSGIILVMQWATLLLSAAVVLLVWMDGIAIGAASERTPKNHLSGPGPHLNRRSI